MVESKNPSFIRVPTSDLVETKDKYAVELPILTLGSFDGMHLGHQQLLRAVQIEAASTSQRSGVISFYPHPRSVISRGNNPSNQMQKIADMREICACLAHYEIDVHASMHFTHQLASLSAHEFVRLILKDMFQCRSLIAGEDAAFGKSREGNVDWMREHLQKTFDIVLIEVPTLTVEREHKVSSREIRDVLSQGKVVEAKALLGRPFSRYGRILSGRKLGRQLGFPTMNIMLRSHEVVPALGVYFGYCKIQGMLFPAVSNVGVRPTVDEIASRPIMEVHILSNCVSEFNLIQPLLVRGEQLRFYFYNYLRPEKRFSSVEALREQIAKDVNEAERLHMTFCEELPVL